MCDNYANARSNFLEALDDAISAVPSKEFAKLKEALAVFNSERDKRAARLKSHRNVPILNDVLGAIESGLTIPA